MNAITLQQIRQVVGGKALSVIGASSPMITSISSNTQQLSPGALFIAIKGDVHDAVKFLPDAAAKGAVAALVQSVPETILPNLAIIQVDNSRVAMGKLAAFVRRQLLAKVIAVGGSNGKTTTKHLIDAVLSGRFRGSISPKSFNNDIGVPLAVFPADPHQDYLVLEIGTNHPGEIHNLTDIAQPDIAVITNCSAEHLEGLVDLPGVRREEASVIEGLSPRGLLVVNGDDPDLLAAVAPYPGKRLTFGLQQTNDLFASDIRCGADGVRFRLNDSRTEVFVPMLGRHTACNALAAIAVGKRMGLPDDAIVEGLAHATGAEWRLQLQNVGPYRVLNDAYNANPASMHAALETLCSLPGEGRRIAVLGDMRELGPNSDQFHQEMGRFVATCPLDLLVCVGAKADLIARSAAEVGVDPGRVQRFATAEEAIDFLRGTLVPGDTVLLKGSRLIGLERVATALASDQEAQALRQVAS